MTGRHIGKLPTLKRATRNASGLLSIEHATLHNLVDVTVIIPVGVMTAVTGVAGSGKSTLINQVLPEIYPEAVSIDQGAIGGFRRSNPASYTGMLDPIRHLFAKANGVSASLFSANSEGVCPECRGLGTIDTDLAFMDPIVTVCEVCGGSGFTKDALRYTLRGKNIREVLDLNVSEARDFFSHEDFRPTAQRLCDVGLGYVSPSASRSVRSRAASGSGSSSPRS